LTLTPGRIHLDPTQSALDATTAKTEGSFGKAYLDIARIQKLPDEFSTYLRLTAQWANKNRCHQGIQNTH